MIIGSVVVWSFGRLVSGRWSVVRWSANLMYPLKHVGQGLFCRALGFTNLFQTYRSIIGFYASACPILTITHLLQISSKGIR